MGRARGRPAGAVPLLRRRRRRRPQRRASGSAARYDVDGPRPALHRQRRPRGEGAARAARQGHRRRPDAGARASACRWRTPSTWRGSSREPGIPSAGGVRADAPATSAARGAASALRRGEVNCLFAADLFNEGLDLPRGRHGAAAAADAERDGLPAAARARAAPGAGQGRADGAGLHRPAPPGVPLRRALPRADRVEPRGRWSARSSRASRSCRRARSWCSTGSRRRIVLDNVRAQLRLTRKELVADVRSHGDLPLGGYLRESGRELVDVYKARGRGRRCAARPACRPGRRAGRGRAAAADVGARCTSTTPSARRCTRGSPTPGGPAYDELTDREQRLARMLFFLLWPDRGGFASYDAGLGRAAPASGGVRGDPRAGRARRSTGPGTCRGRSARGCSTCRCASHAHYRREEILAALGWASIDADGARQHLRRRVGARRRRRTRCW